MRTINATTVQIKQVQLQQDEACLVHDGTRVIGLAQRGTVTTAPGHTVLVGTRNELDAEVARLKLTPAETPDQRRARLLEARRSRHPRGAVESRCVRAAACKVAHPTPEKIGASG